jgi:hypothetical protein
MDRNMDMRYMQDGRNPYGSEGGYVVPSRGRGRGRGRGRRGDRAMQDYEIDGRVIRSYPNMYQGGRVRDYGDMARGDSRADYRSYDMRGGYDGHHPQEHGSTYYPIQAMGTFEGYYGMPNQEDYARSGRRDYGYDMGNNYNRQYMDYGYSRYDYGYDYGEGDEKLSEEELEHFNKKLLSQLSDQEKQMLSKEAVMQRAKALNRPMENFGEKELYTATLMWYTDNKEFFGQNVDFAVKGGYAFLADKDVKVKGAEKLAVYYDCIVEGE